MSVENKIYKRDEAKDGDGYTPETWRTFFDKKQVLITCKHGNNALIAGRGNGTDWKIASNGAVSPSIWWKGTCDCHIYVTLEGWTLPS